MRDERERATRMRVWSWAGPSSASWRGRRRGWAYPEDHGWQRALAWLALFPPETKLQKISDIDRCLLFVALPIKGSDPFDRHRNFCTRTDS
jgi:hypothetical protein